MDKTERISTSITPDVKQKIRVVAAEERRQMSDWVREAIHEKLERDGHQEGNPTTGEQPAD